MGWQDHWNTQRSIMIFSDITNDMALGVIQQLIGWSLEDKTKPIKIWLNTNGGDILHANAITQVMEHLPAPVWTVGIGKVYSAGLFVFLAGHERFAFPNTLFMSHQFRAGSEAQHEDLVGRRDSEDWIHSLLVQHFVKYSIVRKPQTEKIFLSHEYYFDEQKAKEYGIVDHIVVDKRFFT